MKLYVQFSQKTFENEFQIDFRTLDRNIDIPVRLALKDGVGELIDGLDIDFTITVSGN